MLRLSWLGPAAELFVVRRLPIFMIFFCPSMPSNHIRRRRRRLTTLMAVAVSGYFDLRVRVVFLHSHFCQHQSSSVVCWSMRRGMWDAVRCDTDHVGVGTGITNHLSISHPSSPHMNSTRGARSNQLATATHMQQKLRQLNYY